MASSCPRCARPAAGGRPACLYCGALLAGSGGPATTQPATAPRPPPAPLPPAIPSPRPPAAPPAMACPGCGGSPGATPLSIEGWEDATGLIDTLRSRTRYAIRTVRAPGHCAACAPGFLLRRLGATALLVAPLVLAGALGNRASWVLIFLYGLYLLKWGQYGWADMVVYGIALRDRLEGWCPPGRTKFPVGLLHYLGRLGLALAIVPVAALGWALVTTPARPPVALAVDGDAAAPGQGAFPRAKAAAAATAAIHAAAAAGDVAAVREQLDALPALVDRRWTAEQMTLLHQAAKAGSPELAALLVERGLPVDAPNSRGESALQWAAGMGQAGVVRELLARGADPDRADPNRRTPLHAAARAKQVDTARLLLDAGARAEARTVEGATVLQVARASGATEVEALLGERGVSE